MGALKEPTYPRIWIAAHGGEEAVAALLGTKEADTVPDTAVLSLCNSNNEKVQLEAYKYATQRRFILSNPPLVEELLTKMAADSEQVIRHLAAVNFETPPETLVLLATDADTHVRSAALLNPNLNGESLKSITPLVAYPGRPLNKTVRAAVSKALAHANGTRRTRLLQPEEIFDDIHYVIKERDHYAVAHSHGGHVGKSYGYRADATASLVFRAGDLVVVQIRAVNAQGSGTGFGRIDSFAAKTSAGDASRRTVLFNCKISPITCVFIRIARRKPKKRAAPASP